MCSCHTSYIPHSHVVFAVTDVEKEIVIYHGTLIKPVKNRVQRTRRTDVSEIKWDACATVQTAVNGRKICNFGAPPKMRTLNSECIISFRKAINHRLSWLILPVRQARGLSVSHANLPFAVQPPLNAVFFIPPPIAGLFRNGVWIWRPARRERAAWSHSHRPTLAGLNFPENVFTLRYLSGNSYVSTGTSSECCVRILMNGELVVWKWFEFDAGTLLWVGSTK